VTLFIVTALSIAAPWVTRGLQGTMRKPADLNIVDE
jgi:hypothetical protein